MAVVSQIRSPQTTGVEWPKSWIRVFQTIFSVSDQFKGRPVAPLRPSAAGPRQSGQLSEASAAFDELTRSGRDDLLVRQIENAWPNVFRQGQLIPAVEYVRANRIRSLLMRDMDEAMVDVDVFVTPSFGGDQLLLTNLTGHPAIALPNGHRSDDGTPSSITFVGRLFGETDLLSVASRWQEETGYHRKRPPI